MRQILGRRGGSEKQRGEGKEHFRMICHALTLEILFMSLFWFGEGVSWGGQSMFCVLCFLFLCGSPGMVLNQGQLSIVVSDWEPYLGTLFPTCVCERLMLFRALCF